MKIKCERLVDKMMELNNLTKKIAEDKILIQKT